MSFANKNKLNIGNVKNVTEAENRQKMNTIGLGRIKRQTEK